MIRSIGSREPAKNIRLSAFWGDLRPAVALSLACCFLAALYGPLELFFTNPEEFKFGFSRLFPVLLGLFGVLFLVCLVGFVLSYFFYQRVYDVLLCAGMATFLCSYIQGMFLAGDLPTMDGSPINWGQYSGQQLKSLILWLVVWAAVALAARFLHRKNMYRLIQWLSLFFTAVLLVTVVSVGIMNDGFRSRPYPIYTKEDQYTMSTDQNLVIFMVDATDGETFRDMLEGDYPQFGEMLEDFTLYPDTVSAYPFTKYALANVLHGQWYENQEDFYTFTEKAMAVSPLLDRLRQEGYRLGFYDGDADYLGGATVPGVENIREIYYEIADKPQLAKEALKLVWFKYAPWQLKPLLKVDMDNYAKLLKAPEGVNPYTWRNNYFYEHLKETPVETAEEKCFRFIHIEGAHVPFRYDKDVNIISEGSYEQNMECTMTVFSSYLQKLKDAGVYDNTAIVLLADHGYDNFRDTPLMGRCNPLLAVKGLNEDHPLVISEAPISYEDLQTAYGRLLDGVPGTEVFDAKEGDQRQRRVLLYYYLLETYIAEYLQTGHASEPGGLVPTGEIYQR